MFSRKVLGHWWKSVATALTIVMFSSSVSVQRTWSADIHKPNQKTELSNSDLEGLLAEVRSLRQDVKRLTELVERRLSSDESKSSEPPAADSLSDETPTKSILFFTASWCGPCQQTAPTIRKLKYDGFPIQIIDVDKEPDLAKRYYIDSIPRISILDDETKNEIDHIVGCASSEQVHNLFRKHGLKPTIAEVGPRRLTVITYSVGDLVRSANTNVETSQEREAERFLKLLDAIRDSIEPDSWEEAGGECTIRVFETTMSLIIRAPQATHEQIQELLSKVRRSQDDQIAFETQIVETCDDAFLKTIGLTSSIDETQITKLSNASAAKLIKASNEKKGTASFKSRDVAIQGGITKVECVFPLASAENITAELYLRGTMCVEGGGVRMNIATDSRQMVNELSRRSYRIADGEFLLVDLTCKLKQPSSDSPQRRLLVLIRPTIQKETAEHLETQGLTQ